MEYLPNGYTLEPAEDGFPLSTDSMVLAQFAKLPRNARVLDLGSGCGTLGLLLCSREESCQITGVELTESAHRAAEENIRRNGLEHRMVSLCADLRAVSRTFSPGQFSVCISNPPYFAGGPASTALPLARREDACTPDDLFRAAAWCLKYGGDFFLVHKPERMAELIAKGAAHGMEAKRLLLLRHRADGPVNLVFLAFRKGGKPGLTWQEESLYDSQGAPTKFYNQVYHTEE